MSVHAALERCRSRAADYLASHQYREGGRRYWLHAPHHSPRTHPGHLLYGTWSGVMLARLVGARHLVEGAARDELVAGLLRFRRDDGMFEMTGVSERDRGNHSLEYFRLHCTNYALGALDALGALPALPYAYLEPLLSHDGLAAWLAGRDWRRPWTEGNNVVNLASLYALAARAGDAAAEARYAELLEWHDQNQDEHTGFWHAAPISGGTALFEAMAGASHDFHLYYHVGRPAPRVERVVDSCLQLGYWGVSSACSDIDLVDVLAHARGPGYRVAEIDQVLERYLVELLDVQHADGGYGDNLVTPHRIYGHTAPPRTSVTWTTWFRMATVGLAACALIPGERVHWEFRDTLGMGYANTRLMHGRAEPGATPPPLVRPGRGRIWLRLRREGRVYRQRATYHARQLIGL